MKRKYKFQAGNKMIEREYRYIPVRYIIAAVITLLEIAAIIGILVALCLYVPKFYLLCYATTVACILKIIASDDNPEYKVPWVLFVLVAPIVGFMLYFMFYSRKLPKKFVCRLGELKRYQYKRSDLEMWENLQTVNPLAATQAKMLCSIASTHIFTNTKQTYIALGEEMFASMVSDLENAEKFIFPIRKSHS